MLRKRKIPPLLLTPEQQLKLMQGKYEAAAVGGRSASDLKHHHRDIVRALNRLYSEKK